MNGLNTQDWTQALNARHEDARQARWTRLRWPLLSLCLPRWQVTLTVRRLS